MKSKRSRFLKFALAIFSIAIACSAFAQSAPDAFNELQSAIEKETAQKKPAGQQDEQPGRFERDDGENAATAMLAQLRGAITRGEPSQLDQTLDQITLYFKSPTVRAAAEKLRAQIRSEREAKEKTLAEQIQSVLAKAAKAVQTATKPADLDDVLRDLSKAQEERLDVRISEAARNEINKLPAARQFVIHWQDYLANRDAGNTQQAIQNLQNASNSNAPELIPRSEILARIASLSVLPPEPADVMRDVMEKTKSLTDLPNALEALGKLTSRAGVPHTFNDPDVMLRNELSALYSAWQNYQAGVPTVIQLQQMPAAPQNADVAQMVFPLKMQLMRLVAPKVLGVDQKPSADEPFDAYFERIRADAMERLDVRLLLKLYDFQSKLAGTKDATPKPTIFDALVTAQNQEEAGQFLPAVISYETALKTGGDLVPPKIIGARLDAIKAAHRAEFEQGMQRFLNAAEPTPAPRPFTNTAAPVSVAVPGDAARWSVAPREPAARESATPMPAH